MLIKSLQKEHNEKIFNKEELINDLKSALKITTLLINSFGQDFVSVCFNSGV